ncbi:MAG: hypothetical protein MI919_36235, partial [Holophagales bacterium]|nr:hypothetical protein [Holophagales bacterium]
MPSLTDRQPLPGSEPVLSGAVIGTPAECEHLEIGVQLRRRTSSPDLPSLRALSDGSAERLHRDRFTAVHGADPDDVAAVERFAGEVGLDVVGHDLCHRIVRLAGSAALLDLVFGVRQVLVTHRHGGTYRSHQGLIHLPGDLLPRVRGVFGLDGRPVARPHVRAGWTSWPLAGSETSATFAPHPFFPTEVAELYGFPAATGRGQKIAILELGGGYRRQDLSRYFQRLGVPMPRITNVSVAGGGNRPGSSADIEVYLDLE